MQVLKIDKWKLEVDVDTTRTFYKNYHLITDDCDCLYCRNFVAAIPYLPKEVIDFFRFFGIEPNKEGEVYECCPNDDGTHLYGGFFHAVGRILDGPDSWVKTSNNQYIIQHLTEVNGFSFGYSP